MVGVKSNEVVQEAIVDRQKQCGGRRVVVSILLRLWSKSAILTGTNLLGSCDHENPPQEHTSGIRAESIP